MIIKLNTIIIVVFLIISVNIAQRGDTSKLQNKYDGKNITDIFKMFGKPKFDKRFLVSDSTIFEYRYKLLETYHERLRKGEKIIIRELQYRKLDKKVIIWLEKIDNSWISVDYLIWDKRYQY